MFPAFVRGLLPSAARRRSVSDDLAARLQTAALLWPDFVGFFPLRFVKNPPIRRQNIASVLWITQNFPTTSAKILNTPLPATEIKRCADTHIRYFDAQVRAGKCYTLG